MNHEYNMLAGELLIAGFEGYSLPHTLRQDLESGALGGVIAFSRNLPDIETTVALTREIHRCNTPRPLFVAIDQEGGPVQRIKAPLPHWPPMGAIGALGDADLVARVGEAMGDELAELGFNLNFAPCADVHSNPDNPIIGPRAFHTDPLLAARYAGAYAAGLTIAGVIPCAKHFPGHGDTSQDSHLELPVIEQDLDALRRRELIPFRALIEARIPMIMTAHILFPALDNEHPATFSERIIGEVLRLELGFNGVVITDDLNMAAAADRYEMREMIERGLRAGVDIFLVCQHEERRLAAFEALRTLAEQDSRLRARMESAAQRVRKLRQNWLRTPMQPSLPLDESMMKQHRLLEEEIAQAIKDQEGK